MISVEYLKPRQLREFTGIFVRNLCDLFRIGSNSGVTEVPQIPKDKLLRREKWLSVRIRNTRRNFFRFSPLIDLYRNPEGPQNTGPVDPARLVDELNQLVGYEEPYQDRKRRHK